MHYHMDLKVREGFPVPTPRQDFSYLPDAGLSSLVSVSCLEPFIS